MERDTMRYWIAEAAKTAREERGRGQVHVAAEIGAHQSTIWRFETHKSFPEDIDYTIAAYASDLECEPLAIWELALKMWREAGTQANVAELTSRRTEAADPAADLAELGSLAETAERDEPPASRRGTPPPSRRRKR